MKYATIYRLDEDGKVGRRKYCRVPGSTADEARELAFEEMLDYSSGLWIVRADGIDSDIWDAASGSFLN